MATETVRRKQVRDLTFKLLTENGLEGWKVRFNSRLTRALGRCVYTTKTIEYQPRYMEQNDWEQVKTTILHEVAHALVGAGHGHGAVWAREARRIGLANPRATNSSAVIMKRFTGSCPTESCEFKTQRDRRSSGSCPRCANTYDPRYILVWTRND